MSRVFSHSYVKIRILTVSELEVTYTSSSVISISWFMYKALEKYRKYTFFVFRTGSFLMSHPTFLQLNGEYSGSNVSKRPFCTVSYLLCRFGIPCIEFGTWVGFGSTSVNV